MLRFIIPVFQNFKWHRPCPSQSFSFSKYFGTRLQGRIILQEEQVVGEPQVLSSEQICLWFVMWSQATCWVPGVGESWTPTSPAGSRESTVGYLGTKNPWLSGFFDVCNEKKWFLKLPPWGIVPLHWYSYGTVRYKHCERNYSNPVMFLLVLV